MWVFTTFIRNDFNVWLLKEGESFFSPSSQQAA